MSIESPPPSSGALVGRMLLGPGPSMVHSRVYEAMQRPLLGHLDPDFLSLMDRMQARLRALFRTDNPLTLAIAATGSAGMEATLVNLVEPDDEVLVCVNGLFGNRMCDIAERIGGRLRRIDRPWGEVFEPEEIAAALDRFPAVRVVAMVHAETSTGAHQPLIDIGRMCRERDRLFLVDAVTSLSGTGLEVDRWSIDACYSGSQKCLSCPPGLAPLTLGPRAVARLRGHRSKVRSWYLDLGMIDDYWTQDRRSYHHTAPISMNYALDEALKLALEEGLEARFERHRLHSRARSSSKSAAGWESSRDESGGSV